MPGCASLPLVKMEAARNLPKRLYKAAVEQRKVVCVHTEDVEFLQEADTLIDVELATGITMAEERRKLLAERFIQADLDSRLNQAIASWEKLAGRHYSEEDLRDQTPEPSVISCDSFPLRAPTRRQPSVDIDDPKVGTKARYEEQYKLWLTSPKVYPPNTELVRAEPPPPPSPSLFDRVTPWWMSEEDQLANVSQSEIKQLEAAALSAGRNRPYGRPGYVAPMDKHYAHDLATRTAVADRSFRESLLNGDLDPSFEPEFWQSRLERRGDIFAPRFTALQGEEYMSYAPGDREPISPRTLPPPPPPPPQAPRNEGHNFVSALLKRRASNFQQRMMPE